MRVAIALLCAAALVAPALAQNASNTTAATTANTTTTLTTTSTTSTKTTASFQPKPDTVLEKATKEEWAKDPLTNLPKIRKFLHDWDYFDFSQRREDYPPPADEATVMVNDLRSLTRIAVTELGEEE